MLSSQKGKPNCSPAPAWHDIETTQSKRLDIRKIIKGDPSHQIVLGLGDTSFKKSDSLGQVGQCVSDQVYTSRGRRWYARKSLPAETHSSQDAMQEDRIRFMSEIKNLSLLCHKHIARLAGSYTDMEGIAYLMEPVSDTTLTIFLEGELNHNARILLRQSFGCLAAALGQIHGQCLHIEQLSSDNISIHHGKLFISGFGALVQTPEDPVYAAPEMRESRDVDGYSRDVWALGVIYLEILMRLHGLRPSDVRYRIHIYSREAYEVETPDSLVDCVDCFVAFIKSQVRPRYQRAAAWTTALLQKAPHKRPNCPTLLNKILGSRQFQEFCCPDCRRACKSLASQKKYASVGLAKVNQGTVKGRLTCIPCLGPKQPTTDSHANHHGTKRTRKQRVTQMDMAKVSAFEYAKPTEVREINQEASSSRATSSTVLGPERDSEMWNPLPAEPEAAIEYNLWSGCAYDHEGQVSTCWQHSSQGGIGRESWSPSPSHSPQPRPLQVSREASPAPTESRQFTGESDEAVIQNLKRSCVQGDASAVRVQLEEALGRRLHSACHEAWFIVVCGATTSRHNSSISVFLETAGSDFVHRLEPGPGGRNALLLAAENPGLGDADLKELVSLLLEHGADPNTVDSRGDHVLAKLIRRGGGTLSAIEMIVRSGNTDLNKPSGESENSPLHLAVEQANLDVVSLLLRLGTNVDPINAKGLTPLEAAVLQVYESPGLRTSQDQADVMKLLLEFRAKTDRVTRFYLAKEGELP